MLLRTLATLSALLGTGQGSAPQEVLRVSTDRGELERAAVALAQSGRPEDFVALGRMLRDASFLARMDDRNGLKTQHVSAVIRALAENPAPLAVELSQVLAEDLVFVAEGDRKSLVLEALARVKPMSDRTAEIFGRSNEEGYFAFNARLLAQNRSRRALALFASMMLDKNVEPESRVQGIHIGIVPRRMDPAILETASRILQATTERAIANAVAESVFDYRQEWFGLESGISEPPAWEKASSEAQRSAAEVAGKALVRRDLDRGLRQKVQKVLTVVKHRPAARRGAAGPVLADIAVNPLPLGMGI